MFLCRLGKLDLDDLLRRAEEMAAWMRSIFEPTAQRLNRKIQELKQERKTFVPAEMPTPVEQPTARESTPTDLSNWAVIDLEAVLPAHIFQISVSERIVQIPGNCRHDQPCFENGCL